MSGLSDWFQAKWSLDSSVVVQAEAEAKRRAQGWAQHDHHYLERLKSDPSEAEAVLATVIPPESWLFRQPASFEFIRAWLAARSNQPVRMLSLGCARGAEAYSLAATAASLGRTAANTEIVAIDLHAGHLAAAARGTCQPLAQRSPLPEWAAAWFLPDTSGDIRLRDEALNMICWKQGDILKDTSIGVADIVMCRNVAIYLSETARKELGKRLSTMVKPDGVLCLGHADPQALWKDSFVSAAQTGGFVFVPRTAAVKHPEPVATVTRRPPIVAPLEHAKPAPLPAVVRAPAARDDLIEIQSLADQGALLEAAARLEHVLAADGLRAAGWSLLGSIRLGQNRDADAEECFRKVVYLAPEDPLSLLQLSELAQRRGDVHTADRMRLRAARAVTKEAS